MDNTKTKPAALVAWPTWPFTRLEPKVMADLLKKLQAQKLAQAGEALL